MNQNYIDYDDICSNPPPLKFYPPHQLGLPPSVFNIFSTLSARQILGKTYLPARVEGGGVTNYALLSGHGMLVKFV